MSVKYYRVEGKMLISHDRYPRWQKFVKDVRALKPEHALEKVFSELGSNHKLKRAHIKVEKVIEIKPEDVKDPRLLQFEQISKIIR